MNLKRRQTLQIGSAALAALHPLAALAQAPAPRVVASFSVLADMARALAPAAVEVGSLVGPNADAHVYAPSPADGKRLAQADLVLVNGLGFEGWMARLVRASGSRAPVITVSDGLDARLPGRGGTKPRTDPHIWQSLAHAQHAVRAIERALVAARPRQAALFQARAAAYLRHLSDLQAWASTQFAALAAAHRTVVTSHDAFGHLGAALNLRFLSPQGWSTGSEPSAKAVAALIQQLKARQARAVFAENISDPKLIRRIADEAGTRVGGTLYSDALSGPQGPASNYLALMRHNLSTLWSALQ